MLAGALVADDSLHLLRGDIVVVTRSARWAVAWSTLAQRRAVSHTWNRVAVCSAQFKPSTPSCCLEVRCCGRGAEEGRR